MAKVAAASSPSPPLSLVLPWTHVRYRFVAAESLPTIDGSRTVRDLVLGRKYGQLFTAFSRRHATAMVLLYFVGLFYRLFGMLAPTRLSGGWWLILASLLQGPAVTSVSFSMRTEFIRELLRTFEFWFFSTTNFAWAALLFVAFQDSRVSVILITWIELGHCKLMDASVQRMQFAVTSIVIGGSALWIFLVGIVCDVIEVKNVLLWRTPRGYGLSTSDALLSTLSTLALLMVRLAYRKRHALRHTDSVVVQCVSRRCRLRLVDCDSVEASEAARRLSRQTQPTHSNRHVLRLEWAPIQAEFRASHLVFPSAAQLLNGWLRWCWRLDTAMAIAMLIFVVLFPDSASSTWGTAILVALTTLAVAPFIALHQRRLLGFLFTSFDFLFLLSQVVLTAASVCHLLRWALQKCCVVGCIVVWFYVLITYDALTPAAKIVLGYSPRQAAVLAITLLVLHTMLAIEITFLGLWGLTDRVFAQLSLFGRPFTIFGIPFLFGRLVIVMIWNCRIVWRLLWFSHDELLLLLGTVQFENQYKKTKPTQERDQR